MYTCRQCRSTEEDHICRYDRRVTFAISPPQLIDALRFHIDTSEMPADFEVTRAWFDYAVGPQGCFMVECVSEKFPQVSARDAVPNLLELEERQRIDRTEAKDGAGNGFIVGKVIRTYKLLPRPELKGLLRTSATPVALLDGCTIVHSDDETPPPPKKRGPEYL